MDMDLKDKIKCFDNLTLSVMGLKIYVAGEAFSAPPMFSKKMAFYVSKIDKTIHPYLFEALTEGLEPIRPPQPPEKPTF